MLDGSPYMFARVIKCNGRLRTVGTKDAPHRTVFLVIFELKKNVSERSAQVSVDTLSDIKKLVKVYLALELEPYTVVRFG